MMYFCANVENVIKEQITWNEHSVNVPVDNVERMCVVLTERCATRLSRMTVWSSAFLWETSGARETAS